MTDETDPEASRASEMVVRLAEAGPGTRVDLAVETVEGEKRLLRVDSGGLRWDASLGEDGGAAGSLQVTAQAVPTWLRDLAPEGKEVHPRLVCGQHGRDGEQRRNGRGGRRLPARRNADHG